MIKVIVLGYGNVGRHLVKAFQAAQDVEVVQVYHRSAQDDSELSDVEITSDISEIKVADVYVIAIPDDEIEGFSKQIPKNDGIVVHTSGSVSIQKIHDTHQKGIFYPLQTFSKDRTVDFSTVPICIEAQSERDLETLRTLAESISVSVHHITSVERRKLHLAAVFVNNFSNHLYHISEEILLENNLSFDLLKPLLRETTEKAIISKPAEVQTGPAVRNDEQTIEQHLELLRNKKYRKIYKAITKSITATHGKKL